MQGRVNLGPPIYYVLNNLWMKFAGSIASGYDHGIFPVEVTSSLGKLVKKGISSEGNYCLVTVPKITLLKEEKETE